MHNCPRRIVLANGLRLNLIHSPDAPRAAALLRVAAGSHDEPEEHPGLAHFLEHLLFLGGAGYRDGERLMPWVQGRGGRLNASTQARTTDYFFEVPAEALGEGLARLFDMLARPTLALDAQQREREVLEAEFIARSADADSLIDAALALGLAPGHPLRRFVAGRRASLALEEEAFQRALHDFHQCHYRAANLSLWLQGPHALDELEALARQQAMLLPAGPARVSPAPPSLLPLLDADLHLRLPGPPRLVLAFALDAFHPADEQALELFADLLADESPGGLLAHLGEQALCDGLRVRLAGRAAGQGLLVVQFELVTAAAAPAVEAAFLGWLDALRAAGPQALAGRLALTAVPGLAPLEQLQQRVRGIPAALELTWLEQLRAPHMLRLHLGAEVHGELLESAGFALTLARSRARPVASARRDWVFPTAWPASTAASGALYLRWRFPQAPCRARFFALQRALRPQVGGARLAGVNLRFTEVGGDWLLALHGPGERLDDCLAQALALLRDPPATALAQGPRLLAAEQRRRAAELPIRQLLDALPLALAGPPAEHAEWAAAQWDCLACGATPVTPEQVPGRAAATALLPAPPSNARQRLNLAIDGESALLLFYPLGARDARSEAAWRLLARVIEPAFFQRLRSELQLGYALFCGFRQVADQRGLLFAVQSPHGRPADLLGHIEALLGEQGERLRQLPAERLASLRQALAEDLAAMPTDAVGRAQLAWQDHLAGVAADHAQRLVAAAQALSHADLLASHAALMNGQGGCRVLYSRA